MPIDTSNIDAVLSQTNLAEGLDEEELNDIAARTISIFDDDLRSRYEWENQYDEYMKLAMQVMETKSYPWEDAANVKYPLLTTSAIQFHARSYPTLVNGPTIVRAQVMGEDPDEQKAMRAERISKHMSFQFMNQIENWDEDMDKLCFALPIAGCAFKKVYYDPDLGYNVSELIYAKDLVVNHWARSLEDAYAKTHIIYKTKNKIREHINSGHFLPYDVEASTPTTLDLERETKENQGFSEFEGHNMEFAPILLLEQHTFYDLDGDGYEEPYIITVDYKSKKLLRIVARYEKDGVVTSGKDIVSIKPEEFFIKFPFIPNPDGGFYDLGFGALLGPLNMATNTLLNQLIDSGTINNLQSGFISKGIRMKAGDARLAPGEWKFIQSTGDDLKKGIFPLPTKEPSDTLFKLLGTIVESGDKLASVAEIFVGKMPGQNTPATTTMATIEQGMKVFTAVYKRIYRSLTKEFRRMYRLNALYLPPTESFEILDTQQMGMTGQSDYVSGDTDVMPMADPNNASETLRLTKAQALLELIPLGINVQETVRRVLEAQDQPNIERLMQPQQQQPDPKAMEAQMKMELEQQKAQLNAQQKQMELQMKQQEHQLAMQAKQMELQFKERELALKARESQQDMMVKAAGARSDLQTKEVANQQKLRQNEQAFAQKQQQQRADKEKADEKRRSSNS